VERDGVWCCPGPRCGSATDGCNGTAECRAPDGPPGSGAYIGEPCIITGGDAPDKIRTIPEIRNGQVWRQPTGSCNTRVVLWVEGDAWMLLGAPRRGEPAMPCSFGGVLLVPRQRITDHLRTRGYVLTRDYLIVHEEKGWEQRAVRCPTCRGENLRFDGAEESPMYGPLLVSTCLDCDWTFRYQRDAIVRDLPDKEKDR